MPKGIVSYGNCLRFNRIRAWRYMIPAFQYSRGVPNGSVILSPGYSFILELLPVCDAKVGIGTVSFAWWEEPLNNCYC